MGPSSSDDRSGGDERSEGRSGGATGHDADGTGNDADGTGNETGETGNGNETGETGTGDERTDTGTERPSTAEKVVMVVSVTFTLLLFAFAGWQIATTPAASTPSVSVAGTERLGNGSVAVTVTLRNPDDVGLVSATVATNCTSPRTEMQFTYMPASSDRTGTLVCPPGTIDPSVSMVSWQRR